MPFSLQVEGNVPFSHQVEGNLCFSLQVDEKVTFSRVSFGKKHLQSLYGRKSDRNNVSLSHVNQPHRKSNGDLVLRQ